MVDVDGKYFFLKQLSKISTPFFQEKCRFTWNSKWFYKWMDHALFQQKNDHTVFISTDYTSQTTCRQTVVCANPAGTLRTHFYFGNHLEFHLELQVILQVNGSRFLLQKNDRTVLLSTVYTFQTTCRQTVMCAGPADTLRTHFYIGISLGISLGITSDFTSEWITIFCNRKMITRYSYQPIMLARQRTSELWCVRALCITYGLISALQITWNFTWNFTWNSKWIYKWRNNAFLEQEKWSHGISID